MSPTLESEHEILRIKSLAPYWAYINCSKKKVRLYYYSLQYWFSCAKCWEYCKKGKDMFPLIKELTYMLIFHICYSTSPPVSPTRTRELKTGKYTYAQLCLNLKHNTFCELFIQNFTKINLIPRFHSHRNGQGILTYVKLINPCLVPNLGPRKRELWEKLNGYICIQVASQENRQKIKEGALGWSRM